MESNGLSRILSISQGAWETKVLSVALEIELFTRISKGVNTVEKISADSGIDMHLLQMIVNACKAMGLIDGKGDILKNKPANKSLIKDSDGYIGDFLILLGEEYFDVWRGFKEVVMTGKPIREDRIVRITKPKYAELFLRAMHGISYDYAKALSGTLSLSGKSLLEVGGGQGTYSVLIAKRNPGIKFTVFDSPFSCDAANRYIKSMGTRNVKTQAGDYLKGEFPEGNDAIMLTYVLHTIAPDKCEALLRKVFDSLPRGGTIVVNEFLLEKDGSTPVFSSLLALNAFMLSNGGALYPHTEVSDWLRNVGFQEVKSIKTSDFIVTLTGKKA